MGWLGDRSLSILNSSKKLGVPTYQPLKESWTSGCKSQIHSPFSLYTENSAEGDERKETLRDYFSFEAAFVLQVSSLSRVNISRSSLKSSKRQGRKRG